MFHKYCIPNKFKPKGPNNKQKYHFNYKKIAADLKQAKEKAAKSGFVEITSINFYKKQL